MEGNYVETEDNRGRRRESQNDPKGLGRSLRGRERLTGAPVPSTHAGTATCAPVRSRRQDDGRGSLATSSRVRETPCPAHKEGDNGHPMF